MKSHRAAGVGCSAWFGSGSPTKHPDARPCEPRPLYHTDDPASAPRHFGSTPDPAELVVDGKISVYFDWPFCLMRNIFCLKRFGLVEGSVRGSR